MLLTELRHTQETGPQPGLDDLDTLLASMRDSGLTLEVREFGERGRLTEARELALYRIVQESLTNALRHGDGVATLELEWGDPGVDLLVTNVAAAQAPELKGARHRRDARAGIPRWRRAERVRRCDVPRAGSPAARGARTRVDDY